MEKKNSMQSEFSSSLTGMYEKKIRHQEKKIYDLKNLMNMGLSMSSNLNFESLVQSILYSCIGQMVVDKVALMLQVDIDMEEFYIHSFQGYDDSIVSGEITIKEESPLVDFLAEHNTPLEFAVAFSNKEVQGELKKFKILDPELIVPLKSKDSLNGIILLGKKLNNEKYNEDEKSFLHDLSKFAAIAVENSRLYLMATLDRMTRLYIHHYFQERLNEEIKRSKRNGSPLSLIMSDIDHFKDFNDTYGHQQGDSVLKETANLFKQFTRSIDIPARYGGEEFTIILPNTSIKEATVIAKRLRKEVEAYNFSGQKKALHVTISLGVTQFNQDVDFTKENFIKRVDTAMYKAKEDGRNRVVVDNLLSEKDNIGKDKK